MECEQYFAAPAMICKMNHNNLWSLSKLPHIGCAPSVWWFGNTLNFKYNVLFNNENERRKEAHRNRKIMVNAWTTDEFSFLLELHFNWCLGYESGVKCNSQAIEQKRKKIDGGELLLRTQANELWMFLISMGISWSFLRPISLSTTTKNRRNIILISTDSDIIFNYAFKSRFWIKCITECSSIRQN